MSVPPPFTWPDGTSAISRRLGRWFGKPTLEPTERTASPIPANLVTLRKAERVDRLLGKFPLVAATYLSKISVPPFGAMGLTLATPLSFVLALLGVITGRMVLDVRRTVAFVLMMSVLILVQLLYIGNFSLGSIGLLFVVHAPYAVRLRAPEAWRDKAIGYFQNLTLIIGLLGIAQYVLQFVAGPTYVFPIENFLPPDLLVSNFNMEGILQYGSTVRRANGVFMLEPSFYSQLLALGIVIELVTRQRLAYFATVAAAILVSYSGTGLMLLSVCIVVLAISKQRWGLLVGAFIAVLATYALAQIGNIEMLTRIFGRGTEFGSQGSSGSMRFVGGFYLFEQFLWPDPLRSLFGFGAGSMVEYASRANVPVAEMILFKVVFDYGIVGACAYLGFLLYCIVNSSGLPIAKLAVSLVIMLGGMYTPFGHCLAFGLLLWSTTPTPASGPRQLTYVS